MALTERYVTSTASGGGDGSIGAPWTLDEAAAQAVSGDWVNVKAGTYARSTSFAPANDGARDDPIVWRGYMTSPGDAIAPVVTLDAEGNGLRLLDCERAYHRFEYFKTTGSVGGGPNAFSYYLSGDHNLLWRCMADTVHKGFNLDGVGCVAIGCECKDFSVGVGIQLQADNTVAIGCHAHGGPNGFGFVGDSTGGAYYCIARNCSSAGFTFTSSGHAFAKLLAHCVSYGNGGDGVNILGSPEGNPLVILNSLFAENGAYGIGSGAVPHGHVTLCGVAFYGNTLGDVDSDVTVFEPVSRINLSADPLIDGAHGDVRLGAVERELLGSGFPDNWLSGGQLSAWRGFPDIGAAQQFPRPVINPNASGVMR